MEEVHVAAGGPFVVCVAAGWSICGACRRPKRHEEIPQGKRFYPKNWISVGDGITGLFQCMNLL